MTETTTNIRCDEHHFVDMEIDEMFSEEYLDRSYVVTRFYCPVKGCDTMSETSEAV